MCASSPYSFTVPVELGSDIIGLPGLKNSDETLQSYQELWKHVSAKMKRSQIQLIFIMILLHLLLFIVFINNY